MFSSNFINLVLTKFAIVNLCLLIVYSCEKGHNYNNNYYPSNQTNQNVSNLPQELYLLDSTPTSYVEKSQIREYEKDKYEADEQAYQKKLKEFSHTYSTKPPEVTTPIIVHPLSPFPDFSGAGNDGLPQLPPEAYFSEIRASIGNGSVNSNHVEVEGYMKSNGTYVDPHIRTAPNQTISDNFSSYPNINPYTGERGYIRE